MTLTQPWATVIAGLLAVAAATIAYLGVLRNLREQRKAERRNRAIDILAEAATAMDEQGGRIYGMYFDGDLSGLVTATNHVYVAATKLRLFGFDEASTAVADFVDTLTQVLPAKGIDNPEAYRETGEARTKALDALVAARKIIEAH
jgi:hypothetical protein